MQPKIALAMIVKDSAEEAKLLEQCLESVADYVDGIFLWVNYTKGNTHKPSEGIYEVVDRISNRQRPVKIKLETHEWTNFGDARNKSFAMVPDEYDFIMWLDTDDTVVNPEKLHQVAAATPPQTCGIYLAYDYAHDQFGNVTVQHYVARMVRNNGSYAWTDKLLHETLEPTRACDKAVNQEVSIYHHADDERREASLYRNIQMLEVELKGEKRRTYTDPRTLYYLGTTYIDVGRTEEAKQLLVQYLQLSGWAEERAQAWTSLGNMFSDEDNVEEARRCYMHGITENPKDPAPYVEMAKIEMMTQLWEKSIEWLQMALKKEVNPMDTTTSSTETEYKAYMLLADSYLNLGGKNIDKALKTAKKALKMRPDKVTQDFYTTIHKVIQKRDATQGIALVLNELQKAKNKDGVVSLINDLPQWMQENPAIIRYKSRNSEQKQWSDKSIVIFAGTSPLGEWGPWSLQEGIGGSEEAVVRLSTELTKIGHEVTVYGNPGNRAGVYDGVTYRNGWELSIKDKFNVFVAWRTPDMFDVPIEAKKKYLWLHDAIEKEELTKDRLANLDKVIVLSKYHRSLFPNVPDNKIMLSANGITPEDFSRTALKQRDQHRVIYMSSHVRGLDMLYEVWPKVKEAVPDANLHVYYGWESYDAVNRGNPERMAWKDKLIKKQNSLKDVTDHGRVSHQTIVQETFKSGVWAYPCSFPEISCITAMKAQSGGAIPVTSTFGALDETVQYGIKVPMKSSKSSPLVGYWTDKQLEHYTDELIRQLKEPSVDRKEMMKWSRKEQSWFNVAKGWSNEFES